MRGMDKRISSDDNGRRILLRGIKYNGEREREKDGERRGEEGRNLRCKMGRKIEANRAARLSTTYRLIDETHVGR